MSVSFSGRKLNVRLMSGQSFVIASNPIAPEPQPFFYTLAPGVSPTPPPEHAAPPLLLLVVPELIAEPQIGLDLQRILVNDFSEQSNPAGPVTTGQRVPGINCE